jgi:hypothetical protein
VSAGMRTPAVYSLARPYTDCPIRGLNGKRGDSEGVYSLARPYTDCPIRGLNGKRGDSEGDDVK